MSLNAIGLLVFPALAVLSLYVIHHGQSPTESKAHVNQRIKRYCIGTFMIWFIAACALIAVLASTSTNEMCQYSDQVLDTCIFNSGDSLQLSLVFGVIALMALIPTLILFVSLQAFHRLYAGYEKPKGKPKLNPDAE